MRNIGQKIKKIRELKNLSQTYMAEQLGIKQGTYSTLEHADETIDLSRLEKIATLFGMKMEDIINFDEKVVFNISQNNKQINNGVVYGNVNDGEFLKEEIKKKDALIEKLWDQIDHLKKQTSAKK